MEFNRPISQEKLKEVVRALKGKKIAQKTPLRVLHRRADKIRERTIIDIGVEAVDKTGAVFRITGDAGIYIKELIHGDEGRTQPNIAEYLDAKCKIKSLDVTHIHDENGGTKNGETI